MRTLLLLICSIWLSAAELAGSWTTVTEDGGTGVLVLAAQGETISGTYTESGVGVAVRGRRTQDGFSGTATLPDGAAPFTAALAGEQLVVLLQEPGEPQATRAVFTRQAAAAAQPAAPAGQAPAADNPLVAKARARLANRTLTWYSGSNGYSSSRSLALQADGRYQRSGETSSSGSGGQAYGASALQGTWTCVGLPNGGVAVVLRGGDGSVSSLPIELTDKEDVILLGGTKWVLPP